jgi:protein-tyrosine-phosphatase
MSRVCGCDAQGVAYAVTGSRRAAAEDEIMSATDNRLRVLFLCTGNSARSQIAETVLNRKGAGRFVAESAGTQPAGVVNPHAIAALERHGYHWTGGYPKHVDGLSKHAWDFVITVCDRARESCPIFPGQQVMAHWGVPDPAAAQGSENEKRRAFDEALLLLSRRIDLFLALPIERLPKLALEQRVQEIGRQSLAPSQVT